MGKGEEIMIKLNENFVVDKNGQKIGVFIDIESYRKMLDELEELDEIRAYDEAKLRKDKPVLF
ncbi:hypothetical protein CHISP_1777 [Chitinispirillum alkaliphilum]|nr:hypothetical protein CHISP_1777 [Chitinispirillum alkaliphilum]